ncbi:MAG: type II secretion system F family protein [Betaproteobacteria bacterium]|jgi:tight adherence protein C|nr:type II secretion system F family protein [Betaproteobacteria bacterium]NBU50376.1 type II secretion system F family protein [Betaproteobacteria bacterium]
MARQDKSPTLDALQAPVWQRLVEPLARLAAPEQTEAAPTQGPTDHAADPGLFVPPAHRERFMHAGLRTRGAPVAFYAAKLGLSLGLPLAVWLAMGLTATAWSTGQAAGLLLGSALLGLQLPGVWLSRRIARRQREIFDAFPDAVDLVIVCIEAGLGIDAALERTGRDMAQRCPALAEELELLAAELRLGVSRASALKHLASRTGVEEVRAFATMLVHTERLGSGVADALRVHAQGLRLKRERRAEEEAAKLPVKLLFPLVFTLFPALMVVLMGPAGLTLLRQLRSAAAGGG